MREREAGAAGDGMASSCTRRNGAAIDRDQASCRADIRTTCIRVRYSIWALPGDAEGPDTWDVEAFLPPRISRRMLHCESKK
jgi:hypothetical protein